ncbi:protein PYRICULARIA ORYZAE RESISTANCE 21-like [Musa acuminata AAA Group]|uniref:protein PYRICULARIA ORYZAE RESISTANCE 21-like n=1 Tax=Musa acuminata AAA Group TaxID=214697 RepID=UPI0031E06C73
MAEIATVIIKVDLQCCTCSRKIKKALCKLQKRFNIQSIVFDEKKNTVTVSGPFNPQCFIEKLRCLACKVIKDVQIKPPPPPPTTPKPPQPPPPPPPEQKPPVCVCRPPVCVCPPPVCVCRPPVCVCPPPVCVCRPPVWPACCKQPCPCFEPRQGCRRCCTCGWICDVPSLPPCRPIPLPLPEAVVRPPMCGFPPTGWPVCCKQPCPCFDPRQGCRRCCTCGWVCDGPPSSAACRPGCEVGGCKIIVGQEPCQSCSIM